MLLRFGFDLGGRCKKRGVFVQSYGSGAYRPTFVLEMNTVLFSCNWYNTFLQFAEDQVVPVAVLSVVWVSIDPKKHKPLSAMKVRQWVSQLLSRSILLGSSADGVSMQ